jgi:hypothetical protein
MCLVDSLTNFQACKDGLIEVKFKFLQNISHYYNNIFTFHMHMFIIFVLSLNKLNTTIHCNLILLLQLWHKFNLTPLIFLNYMFLRLYFSLIFVAIDAYFW